MGCQTCSADVWVRLHRTGAGQSLTTPSIDQGVLARGVCAQGSLFCSGYFAASLAALLLGVGCSNSSVTLADLEAAVASVDVSQLQVPAVEPGGQQRLELEKTDLKFGFIKLTECAPLVIAKEKGYFDDEGLNVEIEAQSNWKVLLDRVIDGQLDVAQIGFGFDDETAEPFSGDPSQQGFSEEFTRNLLRRLRIE